MRAARYAYLSLFSELGLVFWYIQIVRREGLAGFVKF